jgi:glycosyltransferase involved in cell wall biosynthesis
VSLGPKWHEVPESRTAVGTSYPPLPDRDRLRVGMALYGDLTFDSRVRKEARSLAEAGYDVTIVCLASEGARTDLPANVTVLARLPPGAMVVPGSSNPFFTGREGRIDTIRRRIIWLVTYVRGLRKWGRLAVEAAGPVDVWHAHDLTGLAAIVPSLRQRVSLVYDSHELFLESGTAAALPGLARRILRYYERRLVSRAAALITVNDEIAAELLRRYQPRIVAVVHNCPVLETPQPTGSLIRDTTGIRPGAPIVLYHGSLIAGRGIERLMDALLSEGLEGVHLVLMGYGGKREELRGLARSKQWRSRMHVLDPVAPSALLAWVAGADIGAMVNPGGTLNDVYSSPNKLFECLAAGTPVVAGDFPTLRRIIVDNPGGPLGAVCDPSDVEAIATSIRSILRLAPADMGALRTRCRQAADERWNWDHEARTLLSVYANLSLGGQTPCREHPAYARGE